MPTPLEHRLRLACAQPGGEPLLTLLRVLSCADFRTAGRLLAERVLPEVETDAAFWTLFAAVVPTNAKAYLGTFLKAAEARVKRAPRRFATDGSPLCPLTFTSPSLDEFSRTASAIDRRKSLSALLPLACAPAEAARLISLFAPAEAEERVAALLRIPTPLAAYFLFRELKTLECRPDLLRATCVALMKRGDGAAFNLASMVQAYFSLPHLPGTFSLRLRPYELSRLDGNYAAFRSMLSGK